MWWPNAVSGSCRYFCAANTIRRFLVDTLSMISVSHCAGPTTVPQPRYPPLLLTGSLGMVSLLSIATMKILRLPLAHLSRLRISLGVRYLDCFLFLGDRRRKAHPRSWILISRCDPIRLLSRRQMALPASLETPSPLCPALGPRADLHALPIRRFGVAPARCNTKAPPISLLRGSMTRLHGSLPTLNGTIAGYRSKARFRWVVSPFRTGWSRRVSIETFSCSSVLRPPFGSWFH